MLRSGDNFDETPAESEDDNDHHINALAYAVRDMERKQVEIWSGEI